MGTKITRVGALVVLLTLLGALSALAGITADADSVYVDTTFPRSDWGPGCDEGFRGDPEWNPSVGAFDSCIAPDAEGGDVEGKGHCHFKILSEDGTCIHWNSRLTGMGMATGDLDVIFALPVGDTLDVNDAIFAAGSDYDGWDLNYWQDDDFSIQRGETYTFQLTEQVDGCKHPSQPPDVDREQVRREFVVTIPCACVGIRGNVDCDPEEKINLGDITYLIAYLNLGGYPPPCWEEGDVDADSDIDSFDLDYLIQSVYYAGPDPEDCP